MSHQAQYRTAIKVTPPKIKMRFDKANIEKHPSLEILKRAIEITASERNGIITDFIKDNEGKRISCDFAINFPSFKRGIGIKINPEGQVSFIYDAYGGYETLGKEIEEQITQNYIAIAVIYALKQLDYSVEAEEERSGEVLIKGVI